MVAIVTFSWSPPPVPLPPGASPVASYSLQVYSSQASLVFNKTGIPPTATSYTTIPDDRLQLTGAGSPYKVQVTSVDATGVVSLTFGAVQFEAMPPVFSPPVPQGVAVGPVTFQ